jgi:ubiquinone/menaquinone biosynthesis C-methylase UbiE
MSVFSRFFRGVQDTPWYSRFLASAFPLLDTLRSGSRVLDFGTGPGRFLELIRLKVPGADCIGVDTSIAMLAEARRRPALVDVELRQVAPDPPLPFPDASFDVVSAAAVLFLFSDPRPAIRDLLRITRPGAILVVLTPDVHLSPALLSDPRFLLWHIATRRRAFQWARNSPLRGLAVSHGVGYEVVSSPECHARLEVCRMPEH